MREFLTRDAAAAQPGEAAYAKRWTEYLHRVRRREIQMIFGSLPEGVFGEALELGAGDAFQSELLLPYTRSLTSTDFWSEPGVDNLERGIRFRRCDAELVGETFDARSFDLVFSSNMLEHLPDPGRALRGIERVLAPGGLTIHVMPNLVWKVAHVALHVPNLARRAWPILSNDRSPQRLVALLRRASDRDTVPQFRDTAKLPPRPAPLLVRVFIPRPHGASRTNREEFTSFRRRRWLAEFEAAGLDVIAVLPGPLASGYGFGFNRMRVRLEERGLCSEYVYVAHRAAAPSLLASCFSSPAGVHAAHA